MSSYPRSDEAHGKPSVVARDPVAMMRISYFCSFLPVSEDITTVLLLGSRAVAMPRINSPASPYCFRPSGILANSWERVSAIFVKGKDYFTCSSLIWLGMMAGTLSVRIYKLLH